MSTNAAVTPPEYLAGLRSGHADRDGEVALLNAVIREQAEAVAFFASVIKSGEPWTETCEEMLQRLR